MSYRKVGVKNVNFKVSPILMSKHRENADFMRISGGVNVLRHDTTSLQERGEIALQIIDEKGFITRQEYIEATHVARTKASEDLYRLSHDADGPLKESGKGTHKVWVRRKS